MISRTDTRTISITHAVYSYRFYPSCGTSFRSSNVRFPTDAWYPSGHPASGSVVSQQRGGQRSVQPPIMAVDGGGAPSVVSCLTAGTTRAPRPPVTIRQSDTPRVLRGIKTRTVHSKKSRVYLSTLLTHCNITMGDHPKPAATVAGNSVCYNFIPDNCYIYMSP